MGCERNRSLRAPRRNPLYGRSAKDKSGKIMRRLLREIVTSHTVAGDVTTLEDMSVVTKLAAQQDEE